MKLGPADMGSVVDHVMDVLGAAVWKAKKKDGPDAEKKKSERKKAENDDGGDGGDGDDGGDEEPWVLRRKWELFGVFAAATIAIPLLMSYLMDDRVPEKETAWQSFRETLLGCGDAGGMRCGCGWVRNATQRYAPQRRAPVPHCHATAHFTATHCPSPLRCTTQPCHCPATLGTCLCFGHVWGPRFTRCTGGLRCARRTGRGLAHWRGGVWVRRGGGEGTGTLPPCAKNAVVRAAVGVVCVKFRTLYHYPSMAFAGCLPHSRTAKQ